MIISIEELQEISELSTISSNQLLGMCEGIEDFIRHYTNNNFTVKNMTYNTPIIEGKLREVLPVFKAGDTVLISNSKYNNGVYVINDINGTLNKELYDEDGVKVTMVKYPASIKQGVIKLLQYDAKMGAKVGVASESLSRHSISYQSQGSDAVGGYPAYLMTFLKPFMKARF